MGREGGLESEILNENRKKDLCFFIQPRLKAIGNGYAWRAAR